MTKVKSQEEIEIPTDVDIIPVKAVRRASRKPSKYNLYVKEQMSLDDIKALPARERMKAIGASWKAQKE